MNKVCMLILAAFTFLNSTAQINVSPTVLAAGGGVSKFNNIELAWTLGESFVGSSTAYTKMYTAGFQQPTLNKQLIANADVKIGSVSIFPNPVKDMINIHFDLIKQENIRMILSDANGKVLLETAVTAKLNTAYIQIKKFIAGTYYLSLYDAKSNVTNIFKIIKIN